MTMVSVINNNSAKDDLMNNLIQCLFFAEFYKFHFLWAIQVCQNNVAADTNDTITFHLSSQAKEVQVPEFIQDNLVYVIPD